MGRMAAVALDTHALVKELKAAGFDDRQAEAVTGVFTRTREVFDLATKADLRELELRLEVTIEASKAEIIKWMFGTIGVQTLVILGAVIALTRAGR